MSRKEALYVIYRPLPATLLTLVLGIVGGLAGLLLGSAAGSALGQRDPGTGAWDTSNAISLAGTIVADPYPMLLPDDGSAGVLLVGVGKVGPPEDVTGLVGMHSRVTGYRLERGGMRMLEVQSAESIDRGTVPDRQPMRDLGERDVVGEILDAKCFLGAMKPGDGVGHRACAILCIRGGIPPMLRWTDGEGRSAHALVVGADGRAMSDALLELVGRRTPIRGSLTSRDGWLWIEPNLDSTR